MTAFRLLLAGFALIVAAGCVAPRSRAIPAPAEPLFQQTVALQPVPSDQWPADFDDDADTASLRLAAQRSADYLRTLPADHRYQVGPDTWTARDFLETMELLVQILDSSPGWVEALARIRRDFKLYQSVGADERRTVTFSAYYEPTMPARMRRDADFRFPIYGRPDDLVDVDLGLFDPVHEGARLAGRRQGRRLVPYYTRAEIDGGQVLKGRGLEIAWARDPMDILFMQIEGSGWLDAGPDGRLRLRFDGHNGRRYRSVGQHLIESGRMAKAAFNHASFQRYMNDHPGERQALLNVNERYIFFRIDRSTAAVHAVGNLEVPLTAGRSIATDPKRFPKGLLAWIRTRAEDAPLRRFMLNQDEGGAIQGPGRVDFFAGSGAEAERFATRLWSTGELYFLVRK